MKLKTYTPYQTELGQIINKLLHELNDSIKWFQELKASTANKELVQFYSKKLKEREKFKNQIEPYAKKVGINVPKSATLLGAFSRLHAQIKATFNNRVDQILINKAIYHEESLSYEYKCALEHPDKLIYGLIEVLQQHLNCLESDIKYLNEIKYKV